MGKYKNSDIHDKYSDFHWQLINIDPKYKKLYVCDIDRLWIEYDFKRKAIVSVIDIKYCNKKGNSNGQDSISPTERGIYQWFEKKGIAIYIVFITHSFGIDINTNDYWGTFFVINSLGKYKKMDCIEYADWLLSLRSYRKQDESNWKDLNNEIAFEINGSDNLEKFKQLVLFN